SSGITTAANGWSTPVPSSRAIYVCCFIHSLYWYNHFPPYSALSVVLSARWGSRYWWRTCWRLLDPVLRYNPPIPGPAVFHDALLRRVIHIDQAKPFGVAPGPLEVIEQRPDKITVCIHPFRHRLP